MLRTTVKVCRGLHVNLNRGSDTRVIFHVDIPFISIRSFLIPDLWNPPGSYVEASHRASRTAGLTLLANYRLFAGDKLD